MNTTENTPPAVTDDRPDYQIAKEQLEAAFKATGLTAAIESGHAAIDAENWPHVAFTVRFVRNGETVGSLPWKMGVGLIDWDKVKLPSYDSDSGLVDYMRKRANLKPEASRKIAGRFIGEFAKKVSPAEVLATAARDGEALEMSFEDWASEYGYDTDSRKAEKVYEGCKESGLAVRNILKTRAAAREFAEFLSRL